MLNRCYQWIGAHRPLFVDLVRIYLGIGLFIKGIFFLRHPELLPSLANSGLAPFARTVPYIHIIAGLLMALGILTRLAAAVQIPLVAVALFAIHLPNSTSMQLREGIEFSGLTLFLLILIALWGAGPLSLLHGRRTPTAPQSAWFAQHPDVFIDLVRAYLGLGLFAKGFYILEHQDQFQNLIAGGNLPFSLIAAAHYVIPVHFAGGAMLLIGLLTRIAALAQLPLLLGAVFYVYLPRLATLELRQNLEFTALVLFLLSVVAVAGAGRFSVDYWLQRKEAEERLHALEPAPSV